MSIPNLQPKPLKVAIIRSTAIGDVILSTSCVSVLRRWAPNAQILWLGAEPSLSLIRYFFSALETNKLKEKNLGELLKILEGCDLVIDLQTSLRTWLIGLWLRRPLWGKGPGFFWSLPKRRLNRMLLVWGARFRGRWLPAKFPEDGSKPFHVAKEMAALMGRALFYKKILNEKELSQILEVGGGVPRFVLPENDQEMKLAEGCPWVGIAPGASFGAKRAPLDVVESIMTLVRARYQGQGLGFVVLGDKNDTPLGRQLSSKDWGPGVMVVDLCGKLSLPQSAHVLAQCGVVLSNDSALSHLAEALGVPVGVLFGPTHEAFGFSTMGQKSKSFSRADLGCRPCSRHGKTPCRYGDALCFRGIDQGSVADFLVSYL